MLDENKQKIQEVTQKLQKMDERGLAIMNRDASTILAYQEMLEEKRIQQEPAGKEVG